MEFEQAAIIGKRRRADAALFLSGHMRERAAEVCAVKPAKDAQGVWQSTNRFRRSELADLELVAFKAREFISLNEREPQEE